MSLKPWPATLRPTAVRLTLDVNQRTHSAPFSGSGAGIDMLNDAWRYTLEMAAATGPASAQREAFFASLRQRVNTVSLWHFIRPAPVGSLRGTPTLAATAQQGAATLSIQTTAAATLKAGDMLGLGGLLLMVEADCAANGAGLLAVPLVNRLRKAVASGSAVEWSKPTAPFRLVSTAAIRYVPGHSDPITLDFVEAIR